MSIACDWCRPGSWWCFAANDFAAKKVKKYHSLVAEDASSAGAYPHGELVCHPEDKIGWKEEEHCEADSIVSLLQ